MDIFLYDKRVDILLTISALNRQTYKYVLAS